MADDLPFKAEYAKSGRAACQTCLKNIAKDALRIATMVQSPHFDGKMPRWYHYSCFFTRFKIAVHTDVAGFDALRWEDQQKIKERISCKGGGSRGADEVDSAVIMDFQTEYAKSNRSSCKGCQEKIAKGEIRIAKLVEPDPSARYARGGKVPNWYHVKCFVDKKQELGADQISAEDISGFLELNVEDQPKLTKALGLVTKKKIKKAEKAKDKKKKEKEGELPEKETKDEKRLRMQTQKLWKIKDELKKNCLTSELREMLKDNNQISTGGDDCLLSRCADGMMFGALSGCPECENGQLSFASEGYRCHGHVTGWTPCTFVTKKPTRSAWIISEELREENDYLKTYKFKGQERVFPQEIKAPLSKPVGDKVKQSKDYEDQEDFTPVGSKRKAEKEKSGEMESKRAKMKLKGGAVVDPDSGLEDKAHVYAEKAEVFNAILGLVDLVRGTNSYYKIQVLKSDKKNRFWLFRSWGRVGTKIGGNKLENMGSSANAAIEAFRALFSEKTGNEWGDRANFVKYPNRFYPLEIDYGQDDDDLKKSLIIPGSQSKLAKPIQQLIQLIFDIESMKKAMVEFEIDLKKMPLGKLSKSQIQKAYAVLGELQTHLRDKASDSKLLDASNRFYTLIPHDFGLRKPPLLNDETILKGKIEMLDNLLEIEVAYSLLKGSGAEGKDPVDAHYESLNTHMEVLDPESEEFKTISIYVEKTHAKTHAHYALKILEVFKIARSGEANRYKPFKELHNRKLLWHGSRKTNFAGILSQGLRIAPPEAPVTGYMFGKGIYFADMVSKSANYCCTSHKDNTGLLLLCEVALGDMYELKNAKSISKLPAGKHSCKGIGMTEPNPNDDLVLSDGVVVPQGKGIQSKTKQSSLLYNEYIVYDVAQVNIKYLLKMEFQYTSRW